MIPQGKVDSGHKQKKEPDIIYKSGEEEEEEDGDEVSKDEEDAGGNQGKSTSIVPIVDSNPGKIDTSQPSSGRAMRSKVGKRRRFYGHYGSGTRKNQYITTAAAAPKKREETVQRDSRIQQNCEVSVVNKKQNNTAEGGDSFESYGRYVASELRSLGSRYAQECTKLKIQQALFEAHFINEQQQSYSADNNIQYSMAMPSSHSQPQVVLLPADLQQQNSSGSGASSP